MINTNPEKQKPTPEQKIILAPYQFRLFDGTELLVLWIRPTDDNIRQLEDGLPYYKVCFPLKLLLPDDEYLINQLMGDSDSEDGVDLPVFDEGDAPPSISSAVANEDFFSIPIRIVEWMPLTHPQQIMEIPKEQVMVKALLDQAGAFQYASARGVYSSVHQNQNKYIQEALGNNTPDSPSPTTKPIEEDSPDLPPYDDKIGPSGSRWDFSSNN